MCIVWFEAAKKVSARAKKARESAVDTSAKSGVKSSDAWRERVRSVCERATEETPSKLLVDGHYLLKEKGVVDSGAKGFMFLLQAGARPLTHALSLSRSQTHTHILSHTLFLHTHTRAAAHDSAASSSCVGEREHPRLAPQAVCETHVVPETHQVHAGRRDGARGRARV
eukprot:464957-Pleurochrysis_carterae.AAC.1